MGSLAIRSQPPDKESYNDPSKGGSGGIIHFNPKDGYAWEQNGVGGELRVNRVNIRLGHELFHGLDANRGYLSYDKAEGGYAKAEWQGVYRENLMRSQMNLPLRTRYGNVTGIDSDRGTVQYIPSGPLMLNIDGTPIKPTWKFE